MSFVGWLIVAYVAWAVVSAIRKSPAGKIARAAQRSGSQAEAQRELMELLGLAQAGRVVSQRPSVPPERPAVRPGQRTVASGVVPAEVTVDYDDEAERILRERRREVEKRNRALAGEDHEAFDARIRREEKAEAVTSRKPQVATSQLQQLMVWQEILGRPVGMRDS